EICRTFSKFTKRVLDWSTIEVDLRLAFRAATNPPPGPALVEIPTNVLYQEGDVSRQRAGARLYPPSDLRSAGDPAAIERALDAIARAERPLVVAGDGVFWSDAAAELLAFATRLEIPVYARRAGQGAVPEDHPLAVRGASSSTAQWPAGWTARATPPGGKRWPRCAAPSTARSPSRPVRPATRCRFIPRAWSRSSSQRWNPMPRSWWTASRSRDGSRSGSGPVSPGRSWTPGRSRPSATGSAWGSAPSSHAPASR